MKNYYFGSLFTVLACGVPVPWAGSLVDSEGKQQAAKLTHTDIASTNRILHWLLRKMKNWDIRKILTPFWGDTESRHGVGGCGTMISMPGLCMKLCGMSGPFLKLSSIIQFEQMAKENTNIYSSDFWKEGLCFVTHTHTWDAFDIPQPQWLTFPKHLKSFFQIGV